MSTCISRQGEWSDHVLADAGPAAERFVCSRCGVFDEDACLAALDAAEAAAAVPSPAGADTETGAGDEVRAALQYLVNVSAYQSRDDMSLGQAQGWERAIAALSAVPVRDTDGGLRGRVEAALRDLQAANHLPSIAIGITTAADVVRAALAAPPDTGQGQEERR